MPGYGVRAALNLVATNSPAAIGEADSATRHILVDVVSYCRVGRTIINGCSAAVWTIAALNPVVVNGAVIGPLTINVILHIRIKRNAVGKG